MNELMISESITNAPEAHPRRASSGLRRASHAAALVLGSLSCLALNALGQTGTIRVQKPHPAVTLTPTTPTTTGIPRSQAAVASAHHTALSSQTQAALTPGEIAPLRQSGVTAEYLGAIAKAGYPFSAGEIGRLFRSGVTLDYLTQLAKAGCQLNPGEIISLHQAGVTAGDTVRIAKAGGKFNPAELIRMHQSGVPADLIVSLYAQHPGASYSAAEIITMHERAKAVAPGHAAHVD